MYVEKFQCQNISINCIVVKKNFAHRGNVESIIAIRCAYLDLKNAC